MDKLTLYRYGIEADDYGLAWVVKERQEDYDGLASALRPASGRADAAKVKPTRRISRWGNRLPQ